jgi:hypothetical protein
MTKLQSEQLLMPAQMAWKMHARRASDCDSHMNCYPRDEERSKWQLQMIAMKQQEMQGLQLGRVDSQNTGAGPLGP